MEEIQDQSETTNLNSTLPGINMVSDTGNSTLSSAEEQALKIRKPYTITKQRERWTGEEHDKFLEALQLHGRQWRRIEEHIGTKTAVQIRSHAQKFFSKVVKESATDARGSVKPIEIPPPRPKRKPSHPYPRKLENTRVNKKEVVIENKLGGSLSPVKSPYERESGSPTSVLSGIGSDTLGSLVSDTQVTSPAGSNEQDTYGEQEKNAKDVPSKGEEEHAPCLKLFGKTVMVTKPASHDTTDMTQDQDVETTQVQLGVGNSAFCPWSGGMFPMYYYSLPTVNYGDITNPADARMIPMPWWGMCSNLTQFQETSLRVEEEKQKECSGTGSSSEGENNKPDIGRKRGNSDASLRGFMPYKRCAAQKEKQSGEGEGQSVGLCL